MGMTYMKNIRIKREYGVDFGVIARAIVQEITLFMVDLASKGMEEEEIKKLNAQKTIKLINDKIEEIEPEKLINIAKLIEDNDQEYDLNKEEDMDNIENLIASLILYLSKRVEIEVYSFINLLNEKK